MNKLKKYFLLSTLTLAFVSCSSLLEIEPENTISGNVLNNEEGLKKGLQGAYYLFTGISDGGTGGELLGGDFMVIPSLLSHLNSQDLFWSSTQGPAYANFIDKNIIATNSVVQGNWRKGYECINMVNNILANIDVVTNTSSKNKIQGEALAMRGILYFEMIRLWAPQIDANGIDAQTYKAIPLQLEPIVEIDDIKTPTLATIQQVYDQAEKDLKAASELLKPFGKNGTALSYYACQAYLARLSLQKNDYINAEIYASTVINSQEYSLTASPLQAFNNPTNSTEDIFAIQQSLAVNTGDRSTGVGITYFYSSLTESGYGALGVISLLLNSELSVNAPSFSENDVRAKTLTTTSTTTSAEDVKLYAFYQNVQNSSLLSPTKYTRTDNVLPVLRLAEMYLIRAEARFVNAGSQLNQGAIDDLNKTRVRAGLREMTMQDFLDADELDIEIFKEKTRELLFEGQLFHDLKRIGGYVGTNQKKTDIWDSKFILPIPQSEKDAWETSGG